MFYQSVWILIMQMFFSDKWHTSKQREEFLVPISIRPEIPEKEITYKRSNAKNNEIAMHKTKWLYEYELNFRTDLDSLLNTYSTNVAIPSMVAVDVERSTKTRHYNKSKNVQIEPYIYETCKSLCWSWSNS